MYALEKKDFEFSFPKGRKRLKKKYLTVPYNDLHFNRIMMVRYTDLLSFKFYYYRYILNEKINRSNSSILFDSLTYSSKSDYHGGICTCILKYSTDYLLITLWFTHNAGLGNIVIPYTYNTVAYLPLFVPLLLRYCHNSHVNCVWNICHDAITFYTSFPVYFLYFCINFSKLTWVEKIFL